ncbi:hypothetical protein [Streptomyces sp. NPDC049040]|uniref:hypothetical protein n=1 Tax=Streptomyces sp. NPDC049040 TaxID=3365593 RepID=UPI0037162AE3
MPKPHDPRLDFSGTPSESTVPLGATDPTQAAAATGTAGDLTAPPPGPGSGLRRFGPGVPGSDTTAAWHGTLRPGDGMPPTGGRGRRRALRGWLLPAAVLLGVLAYLLWQRFPAAVRVDAVTVRQIPGVQGCHSTVRVVGTLRTSGGPGTVRYRWRRSDGTVSDELRQHVGRGGRSTAVTLLWTFDGPGSLTATATLDVLGPQQRSAATTFRYHCAG